MTTNLLSVIEQQHKALEEWERVDVLGREPHIHRESWKQLVQDRNIKHTAALAAGKQALEQTREHGWSDDQMISFAGMILLQRNHADSIEQRLNRWKLHHKPQGNVQIKTEPTKHGEQEFEKYLKDCAVFSIEPDIAGAFHAGFLAATHPQATEPVAEHCEHGILWDTVCRSCDELPAAAMPVGELTESELMKCIAQAGCFGTVELSYESGPYDIDRPTLNATKLARAILAASSTQSVREPLTDDEAFNLCRSASNRIDVLRKTEAAHGIK